MGTSPHLAQQAQPSSIASAGSSVSNTSTPYQTAMPMQKAQPPEAGASDAEKKLQVLTRELESQMDKQPQGEYYGR